MTIYSVRVLPQWTTITRHTDDGMPCTHFHGFGPTVQAQLADARAKLRAALRGVK